MVFLERLQKESGREYAARVIRENIIQLTLAPGAVVSENELSAQLGLSRTPIREALMDLAKVHIVEILPQKGSRIALIDYDLIEEARLMRLLLERSCVETLCQTGLSQGQQGQLSEVIALQEFCLKNARSDRFFQLDNQFHALIFDFAKRTLSYQMVQNVGIHFDRVRNLTTGQEREHDETLVRQHQRLYNALVAKEVVTATEIVTEHLTGYQVDAQLIRRQYPEYIAP